jgi:hypothetical protein
VGHANMLSIGPVSRTSTCRAAPSAPACGASDARTRRLLTGMPGRPGGTGLTSPAATFARNLRTPYATRHRAPRRRHTAGTPLLHQNRCSCGRRERLDHRYFSLSRRQVQGVSTLTLIQTDSFLVLGRRRQAGWWSCAAVHCIGYCRCQLGTCRAKAVREVAAIRPPWRMVYAHATNRTDANMPVGK